MNGTKVFEDSYCGVFAKQDEFLECLESIGRNSFWERKKSKNLRLVPITDDSRVAEELREKYAEEGPDEGIITDTILNTGLLLKVRNQYYPVRCCAIKSILDRAGISGAGLRRVEKNVYARILNDCLKVAKGEALLRMEKKVYITEEEREKCRKVIDAFAELYEIEDEDILLVDAGRYGFVKLQCYTPSYGFEELDTYTDSNSLFEGLWNEWLSLNVFLLAREMRLDDVLYDDLFNNLPKEKQAELIGRKANFAKKAGITL